MIMCVLLCYPVSIRIYYQQGVLFLVCTMCVRAWVTQFSLKLLQLHIFGKLLVLMNFYALQNFFWFGELWPTFE